jgi:hypothetical protein
LSIQNVIDCGDEPPQIREAASFAEPGQADANSTIGMAPLNYTTKIDADKTAAEIAKCLSSHGVQRS